MKSIARILIRFSEDLVEQPITAQVILEQGILLSIVAANIESKGGEILLEVPHTHIEKVIDAFQKRGVTVVIPKLIDIDSEKCFNCGSCFSLCPVNAISFKRDLSVVFEEKKCVGSPCSLCIDACPARAISLVEQNNYSLK